MNIFRLSNCPVECARQMQDLHIRKQALETTQLLANCYSPEQLQKAPKTQLGNVRKHSHIHHPISKWVMQNGSNFLWTLQHAIALHYEFVWRFKKEHFCENFVGWCLNNIFPENIIDKNSSIQTEQPQCFKQYPQCVVPGDPVAGYKNYYRTAKKSFDIRGKKVYATWTNRDVPEWFI